MCINNLGIALVGPGLQAPMVWRCLNCMEDLEVPFSTSIAEPIAQIPALGSSVATDFQSIEFSIVSISPFTIGTIDVV